MKSKIFLLLIFLVAQYAHGQEKWSLEDCIAYGKEHNIQIKQQLLNVKNIEYDILNSKLNLLPNINANANHNYNWGRRVDPVTNAFSEEKVMSDNISVSGYMTLYNGSQKRLILKQNKLLHQSAWYGYDEMIDNISLQIANQYVVVLSAMENLEISRNQFEYIKKQKDRVQKLVNAGVLPKGELLNIEVQIATEELRNIENQNQLNTAYLVLSQLMNLTTTESFAIEKPNIDIEEQLYSYDNLEEIYQNACEQLPEIKKASLDIAIAEKGIAIARSQLYPTLGLQGGISTAFSEANKIVTGFELVDVPVGTTASGEVVTTQQRMPSGYQTKPFSDQINENLYKNLSLSLRIPIFNNWNSRTAIAKSKISKDNAGYNLTLVKQNLRKKIQNAFANAVAAKNRYMAAKIKVEASKKAFEYAEKRFENGAINSITYNEIKKELINSENQLINNKYQYVFSYIILDFYQGKPLTIKP